MNDVDIIVDITTADETEGQAVVDLMTDTSTFVAAVIKLFFFKSVNRERCSPLGRGLCYRNFSTLTATPKPLYLLPPLLKHFPFQKSKSYSGGREVIRVILDTVGDAWFDIMEKHIFVFN